ncbi:hypothetical protein T440DRAFT_518705 [Plenodomus tracheiphilus IPT5]|uniref:Actin-like ATPase domain-containing protein n=1 Tax=Plenodomus tracheiphilus IPT5 TaxID=1408161 RepID=A0A6A7B3P1_9PLEO|nr:hypothetical protein T440DRAFT_518705 [Plenodomus tracheiphilus IPT5]
MAKGNRLVIGLDYGTTYTGVSFCETSKHGMQGNQIDIIHDWPSIGVRNVTKEKVPSEVTYQDQGIVWGSSIPSDVPRHMWTKLQLDNKQAGEVAKITREISTSSQNSSKQPDEVITDFLAQIKAHLIKNLDQKYGRALWSTMPITLVVTVPAVWSDLAKSRTLDAVDKAGFNTSEFRQSVTTVLTTEPEAAAIHTISTVRGSTQDANFAVGDGFIVCDMGGDLAGCRAEEVQYISVLKSAALMLQNFTVQAKNGFSGTETYILQLPYPLSKIDNDEARGIVHGEIYVTPEDMEAMFQKSIGCTYKLISEQYNRASKVEGIEMKAWGFSESPYVYSKMKDFAGDLGMIAVRPTDAWSAVARGAAAKGIEAGCSDPDAGVVKIRKSRKHYGIEFSEDFKRTKHDYADVYIDKHDGSEKARHQMSWLLKKGQDLPTNSDVTHATDTFVLNFWPEDSRIHVIKLLASNDDKAPTHRLHKVGLFTFNTAHD